MTFFIDGTGSTSGGEAIEGSNMAVHALENAGASARIHLIFGYYDPDRTESEQLAQFK